MVWVAIPTRELFLASRSGKGTARVLSSVLSLRAAIEIVRDELLGALEFGLFLDAFSRVVVGNSVQGREDKRRGFRKFHLAICLARGETHILTEGLHLAFRGGDVVRDRFVDVEGFVYRRGVGFVGYDEAV
jgi:hypothetical protein